MRKFNKVTFSLHTTAKPGKEKISTSTPKVKWELKIKNFNVLILWVAKIQAFQKRHGRAIPGRVNLANNQIGENIHFSFRGWPYVTRYSVFNILPKWFYSKIVLKKVLLEWWDLPINQISDWSEHFNFFRKIAIFTQKINIIFIIHIYLFKNRKKVEILKIRKICPRSILTNFGGNRTIEK